MRVSVHGHLMAIGAAILFAAPASTQAQVLSGTPRLACEAILCLSSSMRPGECNPALSHYFDIKKRKFSDTLKARLNFLNQCPDVTSTPNMGSLVRAISQGAGRCDAAALNSSLGRSHTDHYGRRWREVSDKLPSYCRTYYQHELTDLTDVTPVYIGTVSTGGFWTEKKHYAAAVKQYEAALKQRERRRRDGGGEQWGD